MVNHLRTLLLNRGRDGVSPAYPGEEYVVPNYRARKLSQTLKIIHHLLFGTDPDRLFLNYRLRQLLAIVHASPLAPLVTTDDPRVTYDLVADTAMFDSVFGETVTVANDATGLHLAGDHVCDEGRGRCISIWKLTVIDADTLQVEQRSPKTSNELVDYAITNGLSNTVTLPTSNLSATFPAQPTGANWTIEVKVPPVTDLGVVLLRLETVLGDQIADTLFPKSEIDNTLRAVWTTHPITSCRHAALILGLARRIAEMPQEAANAN